MNLQHILSSDGGTHTIDTSLLTLGGWTLDAGCRDFTFADELRRLGQQVIALDPAEDVEPHKRDLLFKREALYACSGEHCFDVRPDKFASRLAVNYETAHKVRSTTIDSLLSELRIRWFDCIKLDIEGAEYDVLMALKQPPALQLSIEFHHAAEYSCSRSEVKDKLSEWYDLVYDTRIDSLFVLR